MKFKNPSRISIVSSLILAFGLLLIIRLFFIQIVHGRSYQTIALRQYATPVGNIFERGSIFFTSKDGELTNAATLTSGFKLAINPKLITNAENLYTEISPIVTIDHDTFVNSANKKTDPYEEIATQLTKEQADAITALKEDSLSVYQEKWRFYPPANLAAQTIGFVAYKGDNLGGRYGLERQYDSVLSRAHDLLSVNFFAEVFSDLSDSVFKNKTDEGDVATSIEPSVENFLNDELVSIDNAYHSDASGAIIINPKDGSIYAMASTPNFDLNNFQKEKNPAVFENPLVENVYEIGSVVKAITIAAGIDAGVVTPETKYEDPGFVIVNTKRINDYDHKAKGMTSMQDVMNHSLNTGAVYVMQHLGQAKFRDYMLSFGVNDKTGIDLPNETSGLTNNLHSTRDVEYATASFGQGIAMTPIEAARSFSAIANGGNLVTPHVASSIVYMQGGTKQFTYPTIPTKISQKTSETVTRMLVTAIDQGILNGQLKLDHYSVAGKTGTAQMANPAGGYYPDRYLHSFFGYFPAYDPKFLILIYTVNPHGVDYAANTIAHPFMDTVKFLINYYNIPPDR